MAGSADLRKRDSLVGLCLTLCMNVHVALLQACVELKPKKELQWVIFHGAGNRTLNDWCQSVLHSRGDQADLHLQSTQSRNA